MQRAGLGYGAARFEPTVFARLAVLARRAGVKVMRALLLLSEAWFQQLVGPFVQDDRDVARAIVACGRLLPRFQDPLFVLLADIYLHWQIWRQHLGDRAVEDARDDALTEEVHRHMSTNAWWADGEA